MSTAPDDELLDRLVRFRMWEKAQPGSRPVDVNFWGWFRQLLRANPAELAKTLARFRLHEQHVAELQAIRAEQAANAKPASNAKPMLPDFSAERAADLMRLVEEARRRRNRG